LNLKKITVNAVPLAASALDIAPVAARIADRDHFVLHMDVAVHPPDMFPEVVVADNPGHRIGRMALAGADRGLAAADKVAGNRAVVEAADSSHPSFLELQTPLEEWQLIQ